MRFQSGKRKLRNGVLDKRDSRNALESFLALDRALVELFMHFYDVPGREFIRVRIAEVIERFELGVSNWIHSRTQ